MTTTPGQVAQWMISELQQVKYLYQEDVVYKIKPKFGEEFTYYNDNGNLAIGKQVLTEFKKLTGDSVIWERGQRMWRFREKHDEPGRQQY
jgi:hypothetical protein